MAMDWMAMDATHLRDYLQMKRYKHHNYTIPRRAPVSGRQFQVGACSTAHRLVSYIETLRSRTSNPL